MTKLLTLLVTLATLTLAGGNITVPEAKTTTPYFVPYVGVYGATQTSDNIGAGGIQAGIDIGKYASFEVRADTDYNDFYNYTALAKGKYPIGDFTPYAMVGYSVAYVETAKVQDGLALGAGVTYTLTSNVDVFVDFVQYQSNSIDEDLVDNYSTNVGLTYKF